MNFLAVIPARGGSKRCPGKNMAELAGVPLIGHALQQAMDAGLNAIVTTDDMYIGIYAFSQYGVDYHIRPAYLAQDDTPMLPVLQDVARAVEADAYVLLQPTSPFRAASDIVAACALLKERGADSVVSVTDAPNDWAYQVRHAGRLAFLPNIVRDNGAIYIITRDALERGENWYSGECYAYVMPKDRSLDIDTPLDLEIARAIVEKKRAA